MRRIFAFIPVALAALALLPQPAAAQRLFHGCPLQGDAVQTDNQRLNQQKNRTDLPEGSKYYRVRLEDVLRPGPDANRFPVGVAAEMVGFVRHVKKGSKETCNCKATSDELTDTHIDLVPGPERGRNGPRQSVVVEVSPRMRELLLASGKDMSTDKLKDDLTGRWVRVRGWLFYDPEHTENAAATNPRGSNIYKGGNWEIHPITDIKVLPGPPALPPFRPLDDRGIRAPSSDKDNAERAESSDAAVELLEPVMPRRARARRRRSYR